MKIYQINAVAARLAATAPDMCTKAHVDQAPRVATVPRSVKEYAQAQQLPRRAFRGSPRKQGLGIRIHYPACFNERRVWTKDRICWLGMLLFEPCLAHLTARTSFASTCSKKHHVFKTTPPLSIEIDALALHEATKWQVISHAAQYTKLQFALNRLIRCCHIAPPSMAFL
jgi:hypothetical protein